MRYIERIALRNVCRFCHCGPNRTHCRAHAAHLSAAAELVGNIGSFCSLQHVVFSTFHSVQPSVPKQTNESKDCHGTECQQSMQVCLAGNTMQRKIGH